ncbi:DgyrCDS1446 [Dimorphilus gyrociliatus]|uniref:DgyrCDS1446 n=1 Tax=Dimorphilus gyrociliatus TaxID=2664684 RepID=A0A7I8V9G7_9ANNE|nr:DgyrCDS1446 [Dimorphilus gyrociliatus]
MATDTSNQEVCPCDLTPISRGEREEKKIDLNDVKDKVIYDENGKEYKFEEIYEDKKSIIVFVRKANVRLVVIGCGPFKFIKSFRKLTGYKGFLFVDPEREIYKKLGMIESLKSGNLAGDKHIKSRAIVGVIKSTWWALGSREFQGDIRQQGGSLIVGPGPILHFSHIDNCSADHKPINFLLDKAGVDNVSFPKDPRVQDV